MTRLFQHIFITHPQSVDETYFQHMRFAGWFAVQLLLAAGAAVIHAIIPCLFEKTASQKITKMYDRIHNRG